jgi:hypothetical protein
MEKNENEKVTYIGMTNYQSTRTKFGIKQKDRSGHIYCIGKTGAGKSTLLLNMAISDIQNGSGVGIVDPHGDIAESILNYIPKERIKDVVYFNGCDSEYPIAFNPLFNVSESNRHLVASSLVSALKKSWADSWGPRLEHILRNSLLTLLHYPDSSLLDIQPLLTNSDFRNKVLEYVSDSKLLNFWYKEFYPMPPQLKAEAISPIVNKVGLFQTHPLIRNIVSQQVSSFSIADIMNQKKIFIANLSKGALGEDGTQLIGTLLVTQFQTASLSRVHLPINERYPFNLYIDEMHSFLTLSFADILSESRKYGLTLFLTHQYIDQLHEKIRKAILGNVGTLITFRIGASDAAILEQEFLPVFTSEDLVRLPRYSIYIKLLIDGTTSQPFSAITLPPQVATVSLKETIIDYSRKKYGREQTVIDKNDFSPHAKLAEGNKAQSLFD